MTTDQRWAQALSHDDALAALEHFSNMIQEVRDVRMAQALASDELPVTILGAMVQEGCFDREWIFRVMDVGMKLDWARALEWRKSHSDPQQLDQELDSALREGARLYKILGPGAKGRFALNEMLVGLFEFQPSLVARARNELALEDYQTFELATHQVSQTWLARSGLDVARVIMAGLRHNRHLYLIDPWDGPDRREIGWKMEAWLDRSPVYRQAWDKIRAVDTLRMEQERDWMARWLPLGQWEGSPLAAWADTTVRMGIDQGPCPLDHPALQPVDGQSCTLDQEVAQDYINALGYPSMEPMADRARKINNLLRGRNGDYLGSYVLDCPPDYLVASLHGRRVWMDGVMTSEQGSRHIQSIMKNDRRAAQAAVGWGAKSVMEWTLNQPLWQTWRDEDGNSLLASTLIAMATRDKRRPSSLTKAQLLKLVRVAPKLLTDTNTTGQRILDLLDLRPETRSAVERALLKLVVQAPKRRDRPAGRSM